MEGSQLQGTFANEPPCPISGRAAAKVDEKEGMSISRWAAE